MCAILVIGDHEGGELVLEEPGIVIDAKEGDLIIFPSGRISHFNMHYKGFRASMVLHTDKALEAWARDRNGWKGNQYMR
jgi:predicted 2-oxoglutarate/Fe(II)-dependent dioxygenase YbiX